MKKIPRPPYLLGLHPSVIYAERRCVPEKAIEKLFVSHNEVTNEGSTFNQTLNKFKVTNKTGGGWSTAVILVFM